MAALYMGAKAVFAVTSCAGAAGDFAAPDSPFAGELVDCEQPARSSTAAATAPTEHRLSKALMESSTFCRFGCSRGSASSLRLPCVCREMRDGMVSPGEYICVWRDLWVARQARIKLYA